MLMKKRTTYVYVISFVKSVYNYLLKSLMFLETNSNQFSQCFNQSIEVTKHMSVNSPDSVCTCPRSCTGR